MEAWTSRGQEVILCVQVLICLHTLELSLAPWTTLVYVLCEGNSITVPQGATYLGSGYISHNAVWQIIKLPVPNCNRMCTSTEGLIRDHGRPRKSRMTDGCEQS